MEQKMYKAACYCRLSDDDLNDGMSVSIETQITIQKQYCKENQIQIVDFYCDDGFTGTNFDRPGFKRMIEDVKCHKVDTVIVKDLSRLGREHLEVGYYLQIFFPENNVTFIIISENKVITPRSKYDMMLPLRSVINEMLPAEVSDKVRQAFEAKSKNGEFLHPWLPYGYIKSSTEKNKLVIDEVNAPTVLKIFELVAYNGMGMSKIAEYLYDNKVLSPTALKEYNKGDYSNPNPYGWSKSSINNLLHNEVYLGKIVYGKKRKVNFKSKKIIKVDESEWLVCDNAHEPIVSQELWDEVQSKLSSRKRETKERRTENIFRGLLKCADCGGTMRIACPTNKSPYFVCTNSKVRKGGVGRCTTHNIKLDDLRTSVLNDIRLILGECRKDEKAFQEKIITQLNENILDVDGIKAEIDNLDKMILKEKTKYKRLYNDFYDGIIKNSEMFEEMSEECNQRIKMFSEKKSTLAAELEKNRVCCDDVGKFVKLLDKFSDITELTPEILNTLVNVIEVGEKVHESPTEIIQNVSVNYKFISQYC